MSEVTRADVNARMKRTNIKGKDYIDVAQRVQGFWEVFPNGRITTEWLVMQADWCVCQATIYDMDAVIAQGTAFEEKKGNINTTSYIENCETSAIGRALGNAGIGSVDAIASADEVAHAVAMQSAPKPAAKMPARANQMPAEGAVAQKADDVPRTTLPGLVKACRAAGIEDATMQALLEAAIPGKTTRQYDPKDKTVAIGILEDLLRQAGVQR